MKDEPGDVTSLWPSAGEYLPDDPDAPSVTTSLDENGRRLAEESRRLQMILPPIKVVLTNVALGKGHMGSALMGSLRIACFLTERLFG